MEEVFRIEGGHRLSGEVEISGSKNATVALIPAAVLANSPVTIAGVPDIMDVDNLSAILRELNVSVTEKTGHVIIDPTHMRNVDLVSDAVTKLRASYYFMGALLGKYGYVANQAQNPEVISVMKHAFSTIPGILWIITAIVLFFYRLNKKLYNEIVEDLKNGKRG